MKSDITTVSKVTALAMKEKTKRKRLLITLKSFFDLQENGYADAGDAGRLKNHLPPLGSFHDVGGIPLEKQLSPQDYDGHAYGQERKAHGHDELGCLNRSDGGHGEEGVGGSDYDPQPSGGARFRKEG